VKAAVIVLFPKYLECAFEYAPLKKAVEGGKLEVRFFSPIDFASGPKDVEDYQYGGGNGMLLKVDCVAKAILKAKEWLPGAPVLLLSPAGKPLRQDTVIELSHLPSLILVGGHYKGIDARILDLVDMEISIGDFVVSSGELAALVLLDAVVRLIPGVLTHRRSAETDSLHSGLLEPPLYTRPRKYKDREVPNVLLSGHHGKVERWRREYALKRTLLFRPDLLQNEDLTSEDREILSQMVETLNKLLDNSAE